MKRLIAMLLTLAVGLCLPAMAEEGVHRIGVIVYSTADEEVLGFKEYLKGYIEQNFEMVKFVYSDSIETLEEELDFIQAACDSGVEGFMSFLTCDLGAEVALCEKNQAYYMLASGTVSAEDFEAVEDHVPRSAQRLSRKALSVQSFAARAVRRGEEPSVLV